ncbi:MAG: hypothetical protein M1820_008583 [Bogoriella megaspora]|nr:MAG: hypothetical protein M1820_008583 [Bogoriella megaspora]
MPSFTSNKFDPNKDIPSLAGKTYVVTGGSAGIGFGIVAHLLQNKASKIYLLGKKEEHLDEAHHELQKWGDATAIVPKRCDFEDLKQTDGVAKELKESLSNLDGLVCNAGLGVGPYSETKDGVDSHMQVNHFAQAHLIFLLLPLLQSTPDSRLVLQSSDLHRGISASEVSFENLAEINRDIGATKLYARTKLAQILFVRTLARRAEKGEFGFESRDRPWMNATHPGAVSTDQQEQAIEAYGKPGKVGVKAVRPFMKDPIDEGCRSALFAATSEKVAKEGTQGQYYRQQIVPDCKVTEPNKLAQDEALGEKLWKLTEQILSEKLGSLPYMPHYVDPMGKEGVHGQVEGRPVIQR